MRQNDEHGADDGNLQDGELSNFRSLDQNFSRKLKSANKTVLLSVYARAAKPSNLRGDRAFRQPECKLCKPSALKCFTLRRKASRRPNFNRFGYF